MLSREQVNRYLWQKQGFSRDQPRAAYTTVNDLIGIYGTAPTCYLSLAARIPKFSFASLDEEIYERRSLIRIRAMRSSLFLVTQEQLPIVFQATKETVRRGFGSMIEKLGVTDVVYTRTTDRISQLLDGRSLTASELKKAFSPQDEAVRRAFNFIVARMCAEGRLVRTRVRGSWKSDLCEYARFQDWIANVELESVTAEPARVDLARRYFDAYGPAMAEDFQWWSGLSKAESSQAVGALRKELVQPEIRGLAGDYLALKKNLKRLSATPGDAPDGVCLLPVWDAYLMAYKHRDRYLSEPWYDRVYDRGGNATSVVLIQGCVAGVWEIEPKKKRLILKVSLFNKANRTTWKQIKAYGARLAQAIGCEATRLLRCPLPPPLTVGSQNRVHTPLKDIDGEDVS